MGGLWMAAWCASCAPTGPQPRVVGGLLIPSDRIELAVAAYGDDTRYTPRVTSASAWVRGARRPVALERLGPGASTASRLVAFDAPAGARRFLLDLRVTLGEQRFRLTVPFRRSDRPDTRWRRDLDRLHRARPASRAPAAVERRRVPDPLGRPLHPPGD
jgi:hypothetical protein